MKMKSVIFVLMFVMLVSSVLAMDDPITVKAKYGYEVKIYAWPSGSGPLLTSAKGIANENGTFEKTFFSLNVPTYRLQVIIINPSGEKVRDSKFEGMTTEGPIFVDCSSMDCELITEEFIEEEFFEVNESVVEDVGVDVNEENISSNVSVGVSKFVLAGKAIFVEDDGSFNWFYSIGGFVILIALVVFIFMMIHGGNKDTSKNENGVIDDDDKELSYMESRVKETEDRIKKIKDHEDKIKRIGDAKAKLIADEIELRNLENSRENSDDSYRGE